MRVRVTQVSPHTPESFHGRFHRVSVRPPRLCADPGAFFVLPCWVSAALASFSFPSPTKDPDREFGALLGLRKLRTDGCMVDPAQAFEAEPFDRAQANTRLREACSAVVVGPERDDAGSVAGEGAVNARQRGRARQHKIEMRY